jgi:hypothetical protein
MLWVAGEELATIELIADIKKMPVAIKSHFAETQSSLKPYTAAIAKTPPPTHPVAKSFVTLTGSVTVSVMRKTVAKGTPMNRNQEIVFSTDLLSIGKSYL